MSGGERQVTETAKAGLVARLAEVMAEVSRIPKNGYNERQGYKYATESDVMDCVRSELARRGVIITHDVAEMRSEWRESKGGGAIQFVTVRLTFTARGADGETLDLGAAWGQGQDSGEKAVYKAITGAVKYKLLKQFLMSSGDDPEAEKKPIHAERAPRPAEGGAQSSSGAPTVFPNFGPAKGGPIKGADPKHLETYRAAAQKSLADASKAKWHDKERALFAAYEAELARQKGGTTPATDVPKDFAPYQQAVNLGVRHGWLEDNVKHWLKTKRGKSGSATVTAEDVEALRVALVPPETIAPPPGDDDAPF